MTPAEFWEIEWREFHIRSLAAERRELNEWQRTRALAYMIYCANSAEKPKSIDDFWHLPGDPVPDKGRPLTDDEIQRTLELYANLAPKTIN